MLIAVIISPCRRFAENLSRFKTLLLRISALFYLFVVLLFHGSYVLSYTLFHCDGFLLILLVILQLSVFRLFDILRDSRTTVSQCRRRRRALKSARLSLTSVHVELRARLAFLQPGGLQPNSWNVFAKRFHKLLQRVFRGHFVEQLYDLLALLLHSDAVVLCRIKHTPDF